MSSQTSVNVLTVISLLMSDQTFLVSITDELVLKVTAICPSTALRKNYTRIDKGNG